VYILRISGLAWTFAGVADTLLEFRYKGWGTLPHLIVAVKADTMEGQPCSPIEMFTFVQEDFVSCRIHGCMPLSLKKKMFLSLDMYSLAQIYA